MKNSRLFPVIALVFIGFSCGRNGSEKNESIDVQLIRGEAQGTTYSVKYTGPERVEKASIDSILSLIDLSLSVWVNESVISDFNRSEEIVVSDPRFLEVFYRAKEIAEFTDNAFHPMIMPLVKAWGFGPEGGSLKEGTNIDSLKSLVNFNFLIEPLPDSGSVRFQKPKGYLLDVNGIAQGYSVDVISKYLREKGVDNYMVEIGGEVRARGKNEKDAFWRIGVDKPVDPDQERQLEAIVRLENASLATSGSYRKFYEKDGKKYSHTIDPSTGRPVEHGLLSATVLAMNCTDADALATAFMVMGLEKTKAFLKEHPEMDISVFLIYDEEGEMKTFVGKGMESKIEAI